MGCGSSSEAQEDEPAECDAVLVEAEAFERVPFSAALQNAAQNGGAAQIPLTDDGANGNADNAPAHHRRR